MSEELKGTTWRHKGSRAEYIVVEEGLLEWNCAPMVLYRKFPPADSIAAWCRPLEEFLEKFERVEQA